uniref:Immunoglobulin domain-containing protein n=1 Tax=Chelonoidis abingdonii TaxID=106734 RepID=A0A8C0H098_CHEAB
MGEPPAPEPHGQAAPSLVGDRLLERPNDRWAELGWRGGGAGLSPLFNSCLLLKAGREYPKPTIWVSPSRVVALGGSVTIRCEGLYRGLEFVLLKAGHPNLQVWLVPDGTVAEFPIPRVGWEDGGSYTCDCHSITDQSHWLYLSDPVEIIVAGEGYPKPSISLLSPSWGVFLGGAVTVQCCGQNQGLQFMLNKEGRYVQSVNSDFLALFHINNVRQEHGGSYSCSYHSQSEPSAMSDPSDLMELVVRGEGPSSVSPFPAPPPARSSRGLGANRTLRFVLHKAGHPNLQVWLVPDGTMAEFPIPSVSREDGGSYTCNCHSITDQSHWSYLIDPVEVIVAGECYPKPSISLLSPSWGVFLGGAVTVQCCGQNQGLQFMLNKEGRYVQSVNSDFLALFHINNVRQEHGGSYSCSYHSQSEPSAMSDPSDLMELVVRGEGPSSVSPFPAPPPARSSRGLAGTRRAQGRRQGFGEGVGIGAGRGWSWGVDFAGGLECGWEGVGQGWSRGGARGRGGSSTHRCQQMLASMGPGAAQPQPPLPQLTMTIDAESRQRWIKVAWDPGPEQEESLPRFHPRPSPVPPPRPAAPPPAPPLSAPSRGPTPIPPRAPPHSVLTLQPHNPFAIFCPTTHTL